MSELLIHVLPKQNSLPNNVIVLFVFLIKLGVPVSPRGPTGPIGPGIELPFSPFSPLGPL